MNRFFSTALLSFVILVGFSNGFDWVATVPNCSGKIEECQTSFKEKDVAKMSETVRTVLTYLLFFGVGINCLASWFPQKPKASKKTATLGTNPDD